MLAIGSAKVPADRREGAGLHLRIQNASGGASPTLWGCLGCCRGGKHRRCQWRRILPCAWRHLWDRGHLLALREIEQLGNAQLAGPVLLGQTGIAGADGVLAKPVAPAQHRQDRPAGAVRCSALVPPACLLHGLQAHRRRGLRPSLSGGAHDGKGRSLLPLRGSGGLLRSNARTRVLDCVRQGRCRNGRRQGGLPKPSGRTWSCAKPVGGRGILVGEEAAVAFDILK
mmetsp:Transcript_99376/g.286790  ORF Transcript_99376/g.286790 Transcript_99376/m.286790 type:complete len:227 (-) Transcript_99376:1217-1897(-)